MGWGETPPENVNAMRRRVVELEAKLAECERVGVARAQENDALRGQLQDLGRGDLGPRPLIKVPPSWEDDSRKPRGDLRWPGGEKV